MYRYIPTGDKHELQEALLIVVDLFLVFLVTFRKCTPGVLISQFDTKNSVFLNFEV
jgi:hypothetical protein